jgi:hypothetical protein
MASVVYRIVVQPAGKLFRLCNEAAGMAPCGARHYIGEDSKDPKQQWPFYKLPNWTTHKTKSEADTAAAKLQAYLDARTRNKAKTRKPDKEIFD